MYVEKKVVEILLIKLIIKTTCKGITPIVFDDDEVTMRSATQDTTWQPPDYCGSDPLMRYSSVSSTQECFKNKSRIDKDSCESYENKYQGNGKKYYPLKPLCSWNNQGTLRNNGYSELSYKCM